jgi:GDP-L-fucose synthase
MQSRRCLEVVIWGQSAPRPEFLYVDDLASASLFLLENYDDPQTKSTSGVGEEQLSSRSC